MQNTLKNLKIKEKIRTQKYKRKTKVKRLNSTYKFFVTRAN